MSPASPAIGTEDKRAQVEGFPLLRPEKSRWYQVGIACWLLVALWLWFARDQLKPANYLFFALMAIYAIVRDIRLRRTPDRRVEIGAESIRLFPASYWVVNEIDWNSVIGRREEGSGIFLHFKDAGTERAVAFEKKLFTAEDWEQLAGMLKEDTKRVPLEY